MKSGEEKRLLKRINVSLKAIFTSKMERINWLLAANKEFDGLSPLELLWKGKYGIIIDYLEDILLGHMS